MSKLTHPYVDGFVAAVPSANKDAFIEHARAAAVVFKEHGALRVVECWEDDVPEGEVTSFSMAIQCRLMASDSFSVVLKVSLMRSDRAPADIKVGSAMREPMA